MRYVLNRTTRYNIQDYYRRGSIEKRCEIPEGIFGGVKLRD